jgi:hypothetical protein
MAIVSSSKRFIRSPSCQKVIGDCHVLYPYTWKLITEGIWSGHIIYSGVNAHALIADVRVSSRMDGPTTNGQNYKKKPIQMYNPHKAPLLDHYRCVVSPGGLG